MDLFLARPMMHAFGAKSRIVTRDVHQTPWFHPPPHSFTLGCWDNSASARLSEQGTRRTANARMHACTCPCRRANSHASTTCLRCTESVHSPIRTWLLNSLHLHAEAPRLGSLPDAEHEPSPPQQNRMLPLAAAAQCCLALLSLLCQSDLNSSFREPIVTDAPVI